MAIIFLYEQQNFSQWQALSITNADYIIVGRRPSWLRACVSSTKQGKSCPIHRPDRGRAGSGRAPSHIYTTCLVLRHTIPTSTTPTQRFPQVHLDGRSCYAAAKGSVGGSAINYGTWTRGPATDFDRWADEVNGPEWNYRGLPAILLERESSACKSRRWIQSSTDRAAPCMPYPSLRAILTGNILCASRLARAWSELGVERNLDANGGAPLGPTELGGISAGTARDRAASQIYDLSGVVVLAPPWSVASLWRMCQGPRPPRG